MNQELNFNNIVHENLGDGNSSLDSGCGTDESSNIINIYIDEDIDDAPVLLSDSCEETRAVADDQYALWEEQTVMEEEIVPFITDVRSLSKPEDQSESLESVPIVVGINIIRPRNSNTQHNRRDAVEDTESKTLLKVTYCSLKMVVVLDEREYEDDFIQCGICVFNIPISKEGCGGGIERVLAMKEIQNHYKIRHPLAFYASEVAESGPPTEPLLKSKGESKEGKSEIQLPVKSGRPRGRPPKSKKGNENRDILPSLVGRRREQKGVDGGNKGTLNRPANEDDKKCMEHNSPGRFRISIEEKVKMYRRMKI